VLRNAVPMCAAAQKGSEYQQVECARQEVERFFGHCHRLPMGVLESDAEMSSFHPNWWLTAALS
jgi:hypothetical protein